MCEQNNAQAPQPEPLQSETIGKLVAALAKAQASIVPPVKDKIVEVKTKSGATYSYQYADMGAVIDVTKKPLSDNGLIVSQLINTDLNLNAETITTLLAHSSGEWIKSIIIAPLTQTDYNGKAVALNIQERGGLVTYLRRYAYMAIVGIAPEDDDGKGVVNGGDKGKNNSAKTKPTNKQTNQDTKTQKTSPREATKGKPPLPEGKLREIVDKINKALAIDHLKRISAKHIEPYSLTEEQRKLLGDVYLGQEKEIKAELKLKRNQKAPKEKLGWYQKEISQMIDLVESIMGQTYIVDVINKQVSDTLDGSTIKNATISKHLKTGKLKDLHEIISNEAENAKLKEKSQ